MDTSLPNRRLINCSQEELTNYKQNKPKKNSLAPPKVKE